MNLKILRKFNVLKNQNNELDMKVSVQTVSYTHLSPPLSLKTQIKPLLTSTPLLMRGKRISTTIT